MRKFIRKKELASILAVSPRTLDRMIATGRLIPPIRLTARTVGWESEVLEGYLKERQSCAQKVQAKS